MKKTITFLGLSLFFVFFFGGCEGGGAADPLIEEVAEEETPLEEDITAYKLSGTVENQELLVYLEKGDNCAYGVNSVFYSLHGFMVYDGLTVDVSGMVNDNSGAFNVSAMGSYGSSRIIASLYGYIIGGEVIYSSINMNLVKNDAPALTTQFFLSSTDADIQRSTDSYTDEYVPLSFGGWWSVVPEPGLKPDSGMYLTSSSYYMYSYGGADSWNGAVLFLEEDSSAPASSDYDVVWSFVFVDDGDDIAQFGGDSNYQAYPIVAGKLGYKNDGSAMYLYLPREHEYYISKCDLYQLKNNITPLTVYDDETIMYVLSEDDTRTMANIEDMARGLIFPADMEDTATMRVIELVRD